MRMWPNLDADVALKMQSEHIASLGSVDVEISVRERLAFWAKLPERLARLGNRVGSDDLPKVYAALHARIPMVTPDEQRAIQEANAEGDERFWEATVHRGSPGPATADLQYDQRPKRAR